MNTPWRKHARNQDFDSAVPTSPSRHQRKDVGTAYVALHTRLLPGRVEAYETAHQSVWPQLLVAQRDAGIARWLIFRRDLDLFHIVECDDWDRAAGSLTAHPIDQRWQREMAKYAEVEPGQTGPASDRLKLIYHGQPQILLG